MGFAENGTKNQESVRLIQNQYEKTQIATRFPKSLPKSSNDSEIKHKSAQNLESQSIINDSKIKCKELNMEYVTVTYFTRELLKLANWL